MPSISRLAILGNASNPFHEPLWQETQIAGLRTRQAQIDQQKTKLQGDLDALITKLDF